MFACIADKPNNGEQRQGCEGLLFGITNRGLSCSIRYYDGRSPSIRPENKVRVDRAILATVSQFYCTAYRATTLNYILHGQISRPVRDQGPLATRMIFRFVHSRLQMRTFSSISIVMIVLPRATIVRSKKQTRIETTLLSYISQMRYIIYSQHVLYAMFFFIALFSNNNLF